VEAQAHQHAVLFLAALLAPCAGLDHRERAAVLAHAGLLLEHTRDRLREGLKSAFHAAGVSRIPSICLRPSSIEKAETQAAQWASYGVWSIGHQELHVPHPPFPDIPAVWFAYGPRKPLGRPAVGILNSRKPRHLSPLDPWIGKTKALVQSALEQGFAVVSSYGTSAYFMVAALTRGSPLIVVCDSVLPRMDSTGPARCFTSLYGDLFDPETTLFVSGFPPGVMPGRAVRYVQRDRHVAAWSSTLRVAEVRAKGNMAAVLEMAAERGVPIVTSPLSDEGSQGDTTREPPVLATEKSMQPALHGRNRTITPRSKRQASIAEAKTPILSNAQQLAAETPYLMHYTRSCAGPWPGQTIAAYYQSLIEERPESAHTGFDSLVRILEQGTIRGSRKLTRGPSKVVCFTELFPRQLQKLNEWRPGLLRWSFEPYGLALMKERLFHLGARPVIYAVEGLFPDLSDDLRYLFQVHESRGTRWSSEREWRIQGDLHLSVFAPEEMFVIVPEPAEAEIVAQRFNMRVGLAGE